MPSPKIKGISFILLLSLTALPLTSYNPLTFQANVLQTINLNQHLIWQYVLSEELSLVQLSVNGRTVAATEGAEPSTLIVLDGITGQVLWEFIPTGLAQENRTISCLSISADGEYLAIGTSGGSIFMFHRSSSTIVQTWQAYNPVTSVNLSELGTFISIAFAGHIYFLRRLDGTVLWSLNLAIPPETITNVTSDHMGNHLAVSTSTPTLTYFFTSNEAYWDRYLTEPTTALQLNADGTRLFMVGPSSCRLLNQGGATNQIYPIVPQVFAFSAHGNRLALAPNETIFVYSTTSSNPLSNHTFTGEIPSSLGLTFDGHVLLLGTNSGILYTINPSDFQPLWTLSLGEPIIGLLTPSTGDSFLVATPNTLLSLRISSITGFFAYLLPILVIVIVSSVLVVITLLILRPKRKPIQLVSDTID